jgi:hypothetical protein
MYTQKMKGGGRGEKKERKMGKGKSRMAQEIGNLGKLKRGSHNSGRSKVQEEKRRLLQARIRYAMIAENQGEGHMSISCPVTSWMGPLFGRIASMQDLYIGCAGTAADRASSRANLTAAAASSSPGTANGATASSLEQNGRFHVRITLAVHGGRVS